MKPFGNSEFPEISNQRFHRWGTYKVGFVDRMGSKTGQNAARQRQK